MKQKHYPGDEEFLARLKKNMNDPRAEQLPERLRPENLDALLDSVQPAEKKVVAFPVRRIVAAAAAFVLVLAAAFALPRAIDRTDGNLLAREVSQRSGYEQVEAVFRTLNKQQSGGILTGGLFDGAVKYEAVAEEAIAEAPTAEAPVTNDNAVRETASAATSAVEGGGTDSDEDYSSTNVQVAGIDEADFVKTDGKHLYVVTNKTGDWEITEKGKNFVLPRLQIISTDGGEMEVVWTYDPQDKRIDDLFLADGKLVVMAAPVDEHGIEYYLDGECTTDVEIYDVSNASSPVLLRSFSQEGTYQEARIIDGSLLLISRKYTSIRAGEGFSFEPEEVIPKTCDDVLTEEPTILPEDSVYCMPNVNSTVFTVISMVELDSQQPAKSMTVLGEGILYANYENIYLANTVYDGSYYSYWSSRKPEWSVSTDIVRISIADGTPVLVASGNVKGALCSQFAMDEYDGYLRVATNSQEYTQAEGYKQENNFYVLDMDMNAVGVLEGLAPGENMYSVRFEGKTVYAVTFRTVDPFFVIDLSDPTKPTVTGELKIPGYSQYLHPYSESLVIGFGMDAVESADGSTAYYQGFKVAMFDVSDPGNPVEKHTIYIGDRGSSSDILYDHKALLFDKQKNLIGIPISIAKLDSGEIWDYGTQVFDGYIVLGYDEENGFYEKGRVAHETASRAERIERGMYIGDVLYTVSDRVVVSTDLETFEQIDRLEFTVQKDYSDPVIYAEDPVDPVEPVASSTVSKIYE